MLESSIVNYSRNELAAEFLNIVLSGIANDASIAIPLKRCEALNLRAPRGFNNSIGLSTQPSGKFLQRFLGNYSREEEKARFR
jgi:hypothetical protein